MPLEHAILVSLSERPASGYDLARRFDASIGYFWHASHQQIYKVLARMDSSGWVRATRVAQPSRPDKKVYATTPAGRAELTQWLIAPPASEHVRSEFTVKLRALHLIDRAQMLAHTRARRQGHVGALAEYERGRAKAYPDPGALAADQVGPYLALQGGIRLERAGIEWCDEIIEMLEAR